MSNWILGDKFNTVYPHKGSIRVLWESRWKFACSKSVYPFHDGNIEDFEHIFDKLIQENINDGYSDEFTKAFLPTASALEERAEQAKRAGETEQASNLLLRAAVVYRIARFPYVDVTKPSSLKRSVFELQKQSYLNAASAWRFPIREVIVDHTFARGNDTAKIPVYVRVPETAHPGSPAPVVLLMTGLDGYRCDNTQRTQEIIGRGWAAVIAEIPGTADCPVDRADPDAPDRLWDSVLAYISTQPALDSARVAAWGLSAGGYYAIRAAHTHRNRLIGSVAHGPGCHYFLDPEWLRRVEDHEYPFEIKVAWATKHGFLSVEEFEKHGQRMFSLVNTGIVDQPSCRLLLLNGVDDGVVPIEDCLVLFHHGSPKEGRFFKGLPHMGYPASLPVAYNWLEEVMASPLAAKN